MEMPLGAPNFGVLASLSRGNNHASPYGYNPKRHRDMHIRRVPRAYVLSILTDLERACQLLSETERAVGNRLSVLRAFNM